ncbi:MAG: aspartyl protease family protein [Candidatus Tumulicola sp.]
MPDRRLAFGAACLVLVFATALVAKADEALTPSTISIAELLSRVRKADGVPSRGAYHIVLRGVADGETSLEETFSNSQGYRTVETTAGVASSWGEFQGRQWYQNPNGFVQHVSGAFAQNDPIENAVRNIGAPGGDATLLGVSAASPAAYVVQLAPQEGLSETRYYDAETYLLQRVDVKDYDGRTRIAEYGDYRRISGRMVPFIRTYRSDFNKGSRRYDVATYEAVRPESVNLTIPQSRTLFTLQGRDSVTIPAEFTDDGIIVRMDVGQRGLDLLLDSGSSSIVINASVASDLGLALHDKRVESFGGLYSLADASIGDVSIGPLHAATASINVAPVDEDVAATKRVVGLLGCDFIASGALEVDFARKSLTLFAKPPADLVANGWTQVPISLDDCVPLVKATFSGAAGEFILDLGAYDTVLYDHYFAQFKANAAPAHGDPWIGVGSFIGGDEWKFQSYSMQTFGIGNLLFADAIVAVPMTKKAQERSYDGLLGRTTMSYFAILFDYADGFVYLKPTV